jgi:hypothetical protein
MMRVRYRIWQLWRALTGRLNTQEDAFAQRTLTPAEYALFVCMPPYDQRHCMDVALVLGRLGVTDEAVLALALLHDIGKVGDDGRALSLWWYGVAVVLRPLPAIREWALPRCEPLRRSMTHEQRSITMATAGGARADVIALLTALATGGNEARIARFIEADDQC